MSLLNSANQSPLKVEVKEFGKNLPRELIEGGEKLADEIFQLLLVELSIDLPVMVNRHVNRQNDQGLHFKD